KAIAVYGTGEVEVADPEKLMQINKKIAEFMKDNQVVKLIGAQGTGAFNTPSALSGDSPVKNWGGVGVIDFGEEAAKLVGGAEMDRYKTKKYNCSNCPL